MKSRVITGVLLAAVIIPLFVIGGWVLNIFLLLLTLLATYEMFRLYNTKQQLPLVVGILYMALSAMMYLLVGLHYDGIVELEWVFTGTISILIISALMLVFVEDFHSGRVGEMLFAIFYPSIGFSAMFGLRVYDLLDVGFLFLITIATDTFAYIVGVNFGKHRLAEKISPKKSVEGSIGGTLFALLFTMLYIWIFKLDSVGEITLTPVISILLIIFVSIISQIGDLVASKLKRYVEIKDFGRIFPGHGGVMDRFDSALFAAMFLMMISRVVGIL